MVVAMMMKGQEAEANDSVLTKEGRDERVMATLVPIVATHPVIPNPIFNGYIIAIVKG